MAKAAKQFKKLNDKVNLQKAFEQKINKPKYKNINPQKFNTPNYNIVREVETNIPEHKPNEYVKPKVKSVGSNELQRWFISGVASSAVFKVFKVEGLEELDCWYFKLVKFYNHETSKVRYLLVDVNKRYNSADEDSYVEVKSIKEMKDHNVEIKLVDGRVLLAEVCISKKYIMQAISNYDDPAKIKKKK